MGRRGGSSVGMVILVITMAVVLILVARSWRSLGPAAVDVNQASRGAVDDRGETEAGAALQSGELPDLEDARRETDEHARQLQDALSEIE